MTYLYMYGKNLYTLEHICFTTIVKHICFTNLLKTYMFHKVFSLLLKNFDVSKKIPKKLTCPGKSISLLYMFFKYVSPETKFP